MSKKLFSGFALVLLLTLQLASFVNCGQWSTVGNPASSNGVATVTTPLNSGGTNANVMSVNVGNCGVNGYLNEPCVSVTICQPGTSNCATIPNILLDTGSYGLRVFGSVLSSYGVTLNQVTSISGSPVVECAQFGSGSMWGPVQTADVGLGGEPRVTVPIQIVNSTYTVPNVSGSTACPNLQTDPTYGYNGILGVGVLLYDCGSYCVSDATLAIYFSCATTTSCASTALPLASQVINPVGALPVDNNGVILSFPAISFSGVAQTVGTMTIGIGTSTNNVPGSLNVFNSDEFANFTTTYKGIVDDQSFIDSGSNALYFPDNSIAACRDAADFYCPASQLTLTAIQKSQTTASAQTITFYVGNADSITQPFSLTDGVLNNFGGTGNALQFDWGFPFFLGRTIYVGLETKASSLASGPYWAY